MYQQINLYQPVFRQQSKIFSAITLLQILAVAGTLLLGFYGHARWTLGSLNNTSVSLEKQYQQLDAQLVALENKRESSILSPLENEIIELQDTLAEHRDLLGRLDQLAIETGPGFGRFFMLLTQQTLPGLWLTGVRLTDMGETELRGITFNPTLVPRYLQQLPDQPRFNSLQQGSVHIARPEAERPEIDFILRSKSQEEAL